jgi:hypothetical protein
MSFLPRQSPGDLENWFRLDTLKTEVEHLRAENYKLRRQHELLLSFNYDALRLNGVEAVEVIEVLLDYSRAALGLERPPEKRNFNITKWAEAAARSLELQREVSRARVLQNKWPGQPVEPKLGEAGCPDKVEPARCNKPGCWPHSMEGCPHSMEGCPVEPETEMVLDSRPLAEVVADQCETRRMVPRDCGDKKCCGGCDGKKCACDENCG